MRVSNEELQKIMKKEKVDRIWSWSRINCFNTSPYEYYLKYIKKIEGDRQDSIYANLGGISHEILEKLYTNKLEYKNMLDEFEQGWMIADDIMQLKFDRTDEEKNLKIKDKYLKNIRHFFKNHTMINRKTIIEQFVKIKIGDNLLQGYIDCMFKDDEKNIHIVDFKTSSIYKGSKAENECGQLVLYAIALIQLGIPMEKIKICWNFLKYCTIQYEQANGVLKTREVERYKIGESLKSNIKTWLKKLGYENQIEEYLEQVIEQNSIECLPEEVREKYTITDCYIYVPLTDKLISKWDKKVSETLTDITLREKDYNETGSDKAFWDSDESVKTSSYFFANLSEYSANLHLPYKKYLEQREQQQRENDDLIGSIRKEDTKKTTNTNIEEDLEWLKYI